MNIQQELQRDTGLSCLLFLPLAQLLNIATPGSRSEELL